MTNDLISREAVLKALRARGRELLKLGTSFESNIASVTALECVNIVKDAPAIDAAPVVHGRWYKPIGMMMPPEHSGRYRCSVCDHMAMYERLGREFLSKFCPNCGAKMDKEANP